ncbi:uncharacterized protein PV09_05491 [Verruconis gallopava]|uniref:Uncharacterized protein n=1 Tax=Verruconis gallopava TaxID=253628 RepID=A0A0D2AVT3_9PEZI|nr:uncharacterized protein PV09_05491 [Verruconis gallopava]KIW03274.1 hypothetical protein PV09_05491 [Verruconis gallopava]
MSTQFFMSDVRDTPARPENDSSAVTKWIPIPSAFPSMDGCATAITSADSGSLIGWDPRHSITADSSIKCLPSGAIAWWEQSDPKTTISLGPMVCPKAYYTVTSSAKDARSTFVACCPSGYTFQTNALVSENAPVSQCVSYISIGQVYHFARDFGSISGWVKTSATATARMSALGIPFNGWQFKEATVTAFSAATSAFETPPSSQGTSHTSRSFSDVLGSSTVSASDQAASTRNAFPTSAKIGIGVGTGVGSVLVICILVWFFVDPFARLRRSRLADRVEAASRAQGRGPSPPQPPTPPSLHNFAMAISTPLSLSLAEQYQLSPQPSGTLQISSAGFPRTHVDATGPNHEPAPAPVVGGMGVGHDRSVPSRLNKSDPRNTKYNISRWIMSHKRSQSSHHRRSWTTQNQHRSPTPHPADMILWSPDRARQTEGAESPSLTQRGQTEGMAPVLDVVSSSSQRGARIVTSPIEMAGQRYDMIIEV